MLGILPEALHWYITSDKMLGRIASKHVLQFITDICTFSLLLLELLSDDHSRVDPDALPGQTGVLRGKHKCHGDFLDCGDPLQRRHVPVTLSPLLAEHRRPLRVHQAGRHGVDSDPQASLGLGQTLVEVELSGSAHRVGHATAVDEESRDGRLHQIHTLCLGKVWEGGAEKKDVGLDQYVPGVVPILLGKGIDVFERSDFRVALCTEISSVRG